MSFALALVVLGGVGWVGCASQPASPFYGDERFLVLGVDPNAETATLAQQLERDGFKVVRRLRGVHFSALSAAESDGSPAKVRVVTARGIALALDPVVATPLRPGVRFALMPAPVADTQDADGDGFEEVFVQSFTDGAAPCVIVYRVRDSGFVDRVPDGKYAHLSPPGPPPWDVPPQFCAGEAAPPPDAGTAGPAPEPATGATASPASP